MQLHGHGQPQILLMSDVIDPPSPRLLMYSNLCTARDQADEVQSGDADEPEANLGCALASPRAVTSITKLITQRC